MSRICARARKPLKMDRIFLITGWRSVGTTTMTIRVIGAKNRRKRGLSKGNAKLDGVIRLCKGPTAANMIALSTNFIIMMKTIPLAWGAAYLLWL